MCERNGNNNHHQLAQDDDNNATRQCGGGRRGKILRQSPSFGHCHYGCGCCCCGVDRDQFIHKNSNEPKIDRLNMSTDELNSTHSLTSQPATDGASCCYHGHNRIVGSLFIKTTGGRCDNGGRSPTDPNPLTREYQSSATATAS